MKYIKVRRTDKRNGDTFDFVLDKPSIGIKGENGYIRGARRKLEVGEKVENNKFSYMEV